jgi:hypothetical protein
MILGLHGILGVVFGTTHGTIHFGCTHIAHILDIIHTHHIDHIHTNHITHTILLIILTTLVLTIITVQTTIIMVLKMLIAEIITIMAIPEAMMYAQVLTHETQMAMQHALQITIEMQILM